METEIIFSFQASPEGGYEARGVGHSIFARAETMDDLMTKITEAIACHFPDRNPPPVPRLVKVHARGFMLGSAREEFTVPDDFNDPLPKEIEDLFW